MGRISCPRAVSRRGWAPPHNLPISLPLSPLRFSSFFYGSYEIAVDPVTLDTPAKRELFSNGAEMDSVSTDVMRSIANANIILATQCEICPRVLFASYATRLQYDCVFITIRVPFNAGYENSHSCRRELRFAYNNISFALTVANRKRERCIIHFPNVPGLTGVNVR